MTKRICQNCEKPMYNSWCSTWINEKESVYVHSKCQKDFNIKLANKIINNVTEKNRIPSKHDMGIINRVFKDLLSRVNSSTRTGSKK